MINIKNSNLRINPVLLKELKVKMRGWKAVLLIGGYNLVLTLLTIFIIKVSMNSYSLRVTANDIFGTYVFMAAVQFGLIALIAPALTAGAISGEREKQTLDILMSTTLRHGSIITGKLFASLSHIILLIISSIPVFSIIFLYGIIGVKELMQVFVFYVILAITFGSIGIFFSTFIKKSTAANVLSYAAVIFLGLGTLFITIFYVQLVIQPGLPSGQVYDKTFWLMYTNPGIAFASLLTSQMGMGTGRIFPGIFLTGKQSGLQLWHINAIIDLGLSALLLWLSALKLNPVRRKVFRRSKLKVKNKEA